MLEAGLFGSEGLAVGESMRALEVEEVVTVGDVEGAVTVEEEENEGSCCPADEYAPSPGAYEYDPSSLEQMIASSVTIARVSLLSIATTTQQIELRLRNDPRTMAYAPALRFTFTVNECLKGTCGTSIEGIAEMLDNVDRDDRLFDTIVEALEKAPELLTWRDSRWDDRQAIIFVRPHNFLGFVGPGKYGHKITLASHRFRAWIPEDLTATSTVGVQRFLLDDPDDPSSVFTTPGQAVPTILISELKRQITVVTAEYGVGDGTAEWSYCIEQMLKAERNLYGSVKKIVEEPFTAPSGQATSTVLYEFKTAQFFADPAFSGWTYGREWLEGGDSHMFEVKFPGYIYAKRPMPAGEYRFFYNIQSAEDIPCSYQPEALHNHTLVAATLEAPTGVLAESFFDPYANGGAVTGTTTVGTISWESGRVEATLTQDVTGHLLDCIALDGAASLSLQVADATEDSGTLSWSVPTQP